ncbi:hypothetical protein PHYPSEUDO_014152 [Phytophthora pseudosyringae]|uniref:H15 domain-containing protein n=1 Tax=Phytophthora pseudosyringae TaxID=221518 RepID=A0A8T1W6G2_9STRA|nr:hypothetical protein PHYPSEUDO_014152 [Phytophthora pseudosyringae]
MPSAPSTKKANAGPGYYDLIKEAVISLKERSGSSRHAIDKYVAAKKGAGYSKSRLNIALKRGVETGKLVPVKGSFKLAADEKKVAKKPVAKKAAALAKKPATKTAKKPAAKKTAAKPAKNAKKPAAKTAKKSAAKASKKVSAKKPKTTKKKVVKKSAAKKKAVKKSAAKKTTKTAKK